MNFYRILGVDDVHFNDFYNLYRTAFPASERRSWAGLDREFNTESKFYANALMQQDEFVGFFNYWIFEKFFYIEHFALISKFRGQRIGAKAMGIFQDQVSFPIILEVEMPNNSEATRRIRFYEDLGFKVLSHYYAQPPYEGGGFLLPMLIMSTDVHFANTHFEHIRETLYTEVYHFKNFS